MALTRGRRPSDYNPDDCILCTSRCFGVIAGTILRRVHS